MASVRVLCWVWINLVAPKGQPPSQSISTTYLMTYDRETREIVLPYVRQLQERPCGHGNSHPLFPVSCYPPTWSHHQSLLFLTYPFFLWCSIQPHPNSFLPSSITCPIKAVKDANAISRNCWACSFHTCVSFHLGVWRYGIYDSDTMIKNATPVHKVWAGSAASFVFSLVFSIPLPFICTYVQEAPPCMHVLLSALENWELGLWWVTSCLHDSPDIQVTLRKVHSFLCLKKNPLLLWKRSQKSSRGIPEKILPLDWALLCWRQKLGKARYPHAVLRPVVASESCTPENSRRNFPGIICFSMISL